MASVLTAVFTAMAVVVKYIVGFRFPIFGANGLQVSFAGIFTFFPAVAFGPVYGGAATALCDIIGYIVKPDGAYVPWFTVVAFIGGFVKGLVWKLITATFGKKTNAAVKISFACICLIILIVGSAFTVSVNNDGVMNGIVAYQDALPFEDVVNERATSPLSFAASSLAKYNRDTLTLKSIQPDENGVAVLPSAVVSGDTKLSVAKLDAAIFNTEGLEKLYIPSSYTAVNVPEDFKFTNTVVTVVFDAPASGLSSFVAEYSIPNHTVDETDMRYSVHEGAFGKEYKTDSFRITSSDRYRKYLAGYLNLVCIGFILTGVLGLVFIGAGYLLSLLNKKTKVIDLTLYIKVFVAVLISGLIVTTLNTFVMMELYYAGRLFWVVYIPRLAEELLMQVIQAYIITLILSLLSAHGVFRKLLGGNGFGINEKAQEKKGEQLCQEAAQDQTNSQS